MYFRDRRMWGRIKKLEEKNQNSSTAKDSTVKNVQEQDQSWNCIISGHQAKCSETIISR